MVNYTIVWMFENRRRGRQARNFTTNVPKVLDLNSSSEQIFSENCRWVPLILILYRKHELLRHLNPIQSCNGFRLYFGVSVRLNMIPFRLILALSLCCMFV